MGNGNVPPRFLTDDDYQTIAGGDVVTSGTYKGCIQVDATYYWVSHGEEDTWDLQAGTPDSSQCEIGEELWEYCKEDGGASWNANDEVWEDGEKSYRWGAYSGNPVQMVEV